jgi:hypothetical protein
LSIAITDMRTVRNKKKLLARVAPLLLALAIPQISGCASSAESSPNSASPPASSQAKPAPQEIVQLNEVRALPGKLDAVPMFNSNSPEWVKTEGILLSTFPPDGKKVPAAHLNFPFEGEFTLFAHHHTHTPKDLQTLYTGLLVHNPGTKPVTLEVLQAASYQMQEAPFKEKPAMQENPSGEIYSGPGIRAVDNVLRGIRQADFPAKLEIPPGGSRMLLNHPTPVRGLEKPINGRSTFMELNSSGRVYAACLTMFAKKNPDGSERAPTLEEWQNLLDTGGFAGPREKTPTPPSATSGKLIYGRVGGVQSGSKWEAQLVDAGGKNLTIPQPGKGLSYAISTLRGGRLGTNQVQTAKMLVRYPDTAYEAHGNYAVRYDLSLPLVNRTGKAQTVALKVETPLKEDRLSKGGLRFQKPPLNFPFFRGTVRLRYNDDGGKPVTRYIHLWHRFGQVLDPLLKLNLAAGEERLVRVDFLYPPDATPPQVLTVLTLE